MILNFKGGNVLIDGIIWLIVILILALIGVIGYKVLYDANTEIQSDPDLDTNAKTASQTVTTNFPTIFDAGFVLVVVLMWALVIVASFNVDAHPIFMVFSIFLMTFVLFIGGTLANFYGEITNDDDLGTAADSFPKTTWIMQHLLHFTIAVVVSILIVLFGKNKYSEVY